jgi:hypothetical protein
VSVAGEPLRDIVSRQLVHLGQHGQPLHPDSGRSTLDLYANDRRRDRTLQEVIEWYLDLAEPDRDGHCAAIISAGPPGAGKSTALRERRLVDGSYRYLDADIVKDELLRRAIADGHYADGHYADLLSTTLADTHPIAPSGTRGPGPRRIHRTRRRRGRAGPTATRLHR